MEQSRGGNKTGCHEQNAENKICEHRNGTKSTKNGLLILNQSIPSRNVEKEIFIKIKPCYNCYQYEHITKDCPHEKMTVCANCASNEHKQNECRSTEYKCLNCDGSHRTLAAACPVRRGIIKNKSTEIRDRARSRSRARTYAETATTTGGRGTTELQMQTPTFTKEITATIMTAVITSHYFETIKAGSFQTTFDKIMEANGLPRVIIPIKDIIQNLNTSLEELITEIRNKQTVGGESPMESTQNTKQPQQQVPSAVTYGTKRTRPSESPQEENKKQREDVANARRQTNSQNEQIPRETSTSQQQPQSQQTKQQQYQHQMHLQQQQQQQQQQQ